jgi:catechol 2,3-dioxygenase-like lactoylglutathione lyase family enzyme
VNANPTVLETLHTGFTVADVRATARFFRECLGFTVTEPHAPPGSMLSRIIGVPGAEAQIAYVTAPNHVIELLQYQRPEVQSGVPRSPCEVGFAHVAFLVGDVGAVARMAAEYGFRVQADIPRIETGRSKGRRATYIRDAFGFTIELMGN